MSNNIKYRFLILMLIVLVGCKARNNKIEEILDCDQRTYKFVDDSKLANRIKYKSYINEKDSTLEISIELINKSDSTVLIPITEWTYYSNKLVPTSLRLIFPSGAPCLINCRLKDSRKDYQIEGLEPGLLISDINSFPYFLELVKNGKTRIFLKLPIFTMRNPYPESPSNTKERMFAKDSTYDICINLSLISKHNLIQLFGQNNEYNRLFKKNSNVNFTTPITYLSNAIIDSSNIPINKNIRKKLDSLSRNRLVIDIFHKF